MKHALTATAAALATATTLVLTGATAAHAESTTVDDRAGDVWRFPAERGDWVRVRSPRNADIDTTFVDHTANEVVLTTTYERLGRKDNQFFTVWTIESDNGNNADVVVGAEPGQWRGEVGFYPTSGPPPRTLPNPRMPARGQVECTTITHDIGYRADRVTVTVPRSCFGDPASVRVRSFAVAYNKTQKKTWYDNGHNRTHNFGGWTSPLASGDPVD